MTVFENDSPVGTAPAETQAAPPVNIYEPTSKELAQKIAKETCILEVHRREPGFQKRIDSKIVLNGPNEFVDPKRLQVTKALVDRKEIKELVRHRQRFFNDLTEMSLPSGMLTIGNGQYLIPVARIPEVKQTIDQYIAEREQLLNDFEARYPAIIEAAKERLGPLFNETDYPAFHVIRGGYDTSYKFISNTVPEEIEKVSREIYEQEQARILNLCEGEIGFIQTTLRERFLDLVSHFQERLTPGADGKVKRFHGSNVEHIKDFVKTFAQMNLTGDVVLDELVQKAGALVEGIDPKKVRTDAEFRADLEKGFGDIKASADKLVVERTRKVILED